MAKGGVARGEAEGGPAAARASDHAAPPPAPLRGPYHDWYEVWRAQQVDRRAAEAAQRRQHEADDSRIAALLIAYMVAGGALAALAVALVMAH